MLRDVRKIVDSHFCSGCGACAAFCPNDAITMVENGFGLLLPKVNAAACDNCGICLRVCPGAVVNKAVERAQGDPWVGNVVGSFIGKSTDQDILSNSQSGGVVTACLLHALESRAVDAVVVTKMVAGQGLPRALAVLTSDPTEVKEAAGSKYCPVALNAVLREVVRSRARIGVVGLPCHISAINNACRFSSELRDALVFTIGLFCGGTLSPYIINYLCRCAEISPAEVTRFVFRGKGWRGWPGDTLIEDRSGKSVWVGRERRIAVKSFFTPVRCLLCWDELNSQADISVGDPWGVGEDRAGESAILVRTETGAGLVAGAKTAGKLQVRPVPPQDIIAGQERENRKKSHVAHVAAWRSLGKGTPAFAMNDDNVGPPTRSSLRTASTNLWWAHLFQHGPVGRWLACGPVVLLPLWSRLSYLPLRVLGRIERAFGAGQGTR